jgi:hypothetical protein
MVPLAESNGLSLPFFMHFSCVQRVTHVWAVQSRLAPMKRAVR